MDYNLKVVTTTPLTELWTADGVASRERGRTMTTNDIKTILAETIFVVADVGSKLIWIDKARTFDFWKKELQRHLWDGREKIDLGKFPDSYAYLATEWFDNVGQRIVLLEKFH